MESNLPLHNTCEIAPLRKVLLHRPGRELENLMPDYLERLLFDDIPYLKLAQEEHDKFADTLRQCGVEVLYLTDLTAEAVADEEVRRQFVRDYLSEAEIASGRTFANPKNQYKAFAGGKSGTNKNSPNRCGEFLCLLGLLCFRVRKCSIA